MEVIMPGENDQPRDYSSIDRYIYTEGENKGRIKDVDLADDVALTEKDLRENPVPEETRPGKPKVTTEQVIDYDIERQIQFRERKRIEEQLESLRSEIEEEKSKPKSE
jgi:hypothetical protein